MTAVADSKHAVQVLHNLQAQVAQTGDQGLEEQVTAIITMLDSPVFQQLLQLQVSIRQLKEHIESCPPGKPIDDYDFSPEGDLVFFEPEESENAQPMEVEASPVSSPTRHPYAFENKTFTRDEESMVHMEPEISAQVVQAEESAPPVSPMQDRVEGGVDDFQLALQELALGREIHSIKLAKPEGSGLGFSVVGLKSENHGELGIFVQQIQPGGTADRDGRLQESDQILAIDRELLTTTVSHQMAIGLLQKVRGHVEMTIARGGFTVPSTPSSPSATAVPPQLPPQEYEPEEDEMYVETIELYNDGSGLGFGIVGVKDIGIVVKTILEGGTADRDGRLQSGDRILKIGDTSLEGMTSDQVAVVLRQSGNRVRLTIARGPLAFAPAAAMTPIPEANFRPESAQELQSSQVPAELRDLDSSAWEGDNADVFDVELTKGTQGIGITIAGYVTDQEGATHSGIFVKSVAEGSAADVQGNVKTNDQIIEVDGQSLQGFSNVEAVEVLRKTQAVVRLKLARFKGSDVEQEDTLMAMEQEMREAVEEEPPPVAPADYPPPGGLLMMGATLGETEDETYDGDLASDEETVIISAWQSMMGYDVEIVVAQLAKFREGGGLGISLEGTVDIDENGQEVRPHHYIRSILPDGPVGQNGKLNSGDELLEVNGTRLLGLNHVEVVKTLKELPMHVRLVCARHPHPVFPEQMEEEQQPQEMGQESIPEEPQEQIPQVAVEGAISASTEGQLESAPPQTSPVSVDVAPHNISVTKESLAGLAMWSDQPQVIELMKGDRGLGFSILDYQDPYNPSQTVIVIRSLVPGGVAEQDSRLIPGDRLVSVNDINLEDCSLDMAVGALKGAAPGIVRIGVAKPLPSDRSERDEQEVQQDPEASISADGPKVSMEVERPGSPPKPVEEVIGPAVAMATVEATPSMAESASEFKPPDLVTSSSKPDEAKPSELVSASATPPQPKRKPPTPPPKPVLTPKNSNPFIGSPEKPSSPSSSIGSPERFPRSSTGRKSSVTLPETLEQIIVLKKSNAGLGLTVHAEKGNGVVVKSIIRGGVVQQDGRLAVGDYITAVNNSSIRDHSNQEARSLIRRCSLDRNDISISYIPASVAASFRDNPTASVHGSVGVTAIPTSHVPSVDERPPSDRSSAPKGTNPFAVHPSQADTVKTAMVTSMPPASPESNLPAEDAEDIRTVRLFKEPGKSLGISIVGGRVHDGETMRGIYIKHVLPESPAGRSGALKTGDRILEVNSCDLRVATHDQAVAIIRNSTNPVLFTVQSITPGSRE